jgi:hypothetical protein
MELGCRTATSKPVRRRQRNSGSLLPAVVGICFSVNTFLTCHTNRTNPTHSISTRATNPRIESLAMSPARRPVLPSPHGSGAPVLTTPRRSTWRQGVFQGTPALMRYVRLLHSCFPVAVAWRRVLSTLRQAWRYNILW